jgi:glycosyltransferase involved in cell wall biosynthesis
MKTIKLNLGAGHDHKPGYFNVDIDPVTHPDKIVDLSKPLPFTSESIDEVLLQDVLEHFTKEDGKNLINEINRILKPAGVFNMRIPNVEKIVSEFENDPAVMMEFIYGTTAQNGIWGAHKFGYTHETLAKTLRIHRFEVDSIVDESTNIVATCKKIGRSSPKPHILVIQQAPDWGGAEEWMATLVRGWREKNLKVTGVTNLDLLKETWEKTGATTIHLPFILDIIGNYKGLVKSALLFPYALVWYWRLLTKEKNTGVNCVVMSGFSEKLLVTLIARWVGLPVVWFEYGPLKQVFKKNYYLPKLLYRAAKNIPEAAYTISQVTKNSLITDARISLSKILLVEPGVDIPTKIAKPPATFTIGHLSRLTPEKGQRLLLEAFKSVAERHPSIRLKIAGRGPDETHLKTYAQKLGIADKVEFLGFVQDKKAFYESISIFAFCSTWELEGFGMVMAEAMAHGRPVVAIDNGPTREVVGESGGIIVMPTAKDVANGLEQMIKKDLIKQANKVQTYAKNRYQATIQVAKITKSITDVVNYYF